MIQLPAKTEIETLQAFFKPNSLSIYTSYIAPTSPNNPNRIQLKNLLKEAHRLLSEQGLRSNEVTAILQPANKLLDGEEFRTNHNHSLALFIHQEVFTYYHLPPEGILSSVHIGQGFELQPIRELLNNNPPYYVLLLSHNNVQLLSGDRYHIEHLQVPGLPTNMEQTLQIDEYPNEIQTHSIASAGRGKGSEAFHGQYNEAQVDKEMLVKFFRQIDRTLHHALKDTTIPLIIAGVDYLLPLYRQVSTYPYLLLNEIQGSLEHASLATIQERATQLISRPVVQPL